MESDCLDPRMLRCSIHRISTSVCAPCLYMCFEHVTSRDVITAFHKTACKYTNSAHANVMQKQKLLRSIRSNSRSISTSLCSCLSVVMRKVVVTVSDYHRRCNHIAFVIFRCLCIPCCCLTRGRHDCPYEAGGDESPARATESGSACDDAAEAGTATATCRHSDLPHRHLRRCLVCATGGRRRRRHGDDRDLCLGDGCCCHDDGLTLPANHHWYTLHTCRGR